MVMERQHATYIVD